MCSTTPTPLENIFLNVKFVAYSAGNKFEQIRDETQRSRAQKRQRESRARQAKVFADEEAQLHEQLMIEQQIFEQQQRASQAARPKAAPVVAVADQETTKQEPAVLRLAPSPEQKRKVQAIDQKLALIRKRMAPSKNAAGIASLQAAVAGY